MKITRRQLRRIIAESFRLTEALTKQQIDDMVAVYNKAKEALNKHESEYNRKVRQKNKSIQQEYDNLRKEYESAGVALRNNKIYTQ